MWHWKEINGPNRTLVIGENKPFMIAKLPRKRKKQFIKARGLSDYFIAKMIEEILIEERSNHKPRFVKEWRGRGWNMRPYSYW